MTPIRRSIVYSLLSSNMVTGLQFLGSLAIARLLTPEQVGIFSVAAVIVAVAQILRDMGASGYIIQLEKVTTEVLRASFGLMLLSAGGIALVLALTSGIIADFYGEPAVRVIMLVLALNFMVTPFGVVTMICVRREMRFKAIGLIELGATVVSQVVSIFLAYRGCGAISLAWGAVAGTLATISGSLFLRPAYVPWLPSLTGIRPILGFGSMTISSSILGYLNMAAADIVLGKVAGMSALAYFNRAASLNRFFGTMLLKGLSPVLLPAMSDARRQGADVRQSFLGSTLLLTGVTWSAYAAIVVLARPLILILFGDQWLSAVPLVPYIALTAMVSSTYTMCGATYTALGRPSSNLIAEAINLPIKVVAIIVFAPVGVLAVAQVWPAIGLAGAIVQQHLLRREVGIGPLLMYQGLWKSAAVAMCSALAAFLINGMIVEAGFKSHQALQLVVSAAGAGGVWLLAIVLLRHPLAEELMRFRQLVAHR